MASAPGFDIACSVFRVGDAIVADRRRSGIRTGRAAGATSRSGAGGSFEIGCLRSNYRVRACAPGFVLASAPLPAEVRPAAGRGLTAPGKLLASLRHRDFRFLLASTMALQVGSWVQTI